MKLNLYYIYGDKNNPQQVVNELINIGGRVGPKITGTEFILYSFNGNVSYLTNDSTEIDLLLTLGKELKINPQKKIFRFVDIEETGGYNLCQDSVVPVPTIEGQSHSCDFVNRKQAESAQALAMLGQVRYQGISTYGPIVDSKDVVCILPLDEGFESVSMSNKDYYISCLKFKTHEQADAFIFNNFKLLQQLFAGL